MGRARKAKADPARSDFRPQVAPESGPFYKRSKMAKLSLTASPTFVATVQIPIPGKRAIGVEFTFKGRTKSEFTNFLETATGRDDADVLMDIISGWELEDEFSRENVERLMESYPGSSRVIIEKYVQEVTGARVGN